MRLLLALVTMLFCDLAYSQHNINIQYWQDATVIDTNHKVYENCSCLMSFIQVIDEDWDSFVTSDTAYVHTMQYVHSSPWVFKRAICKNFFGKPIVLFPIDVDFIYLR